MYSNDLGCHKIAHMHSSNRAKWSVSFTAFADKKKCLPFARSLVWPSISYKYFLCIFHIWSIEHFLAASILMPFGFEGENVLAMYKQKRNSCEHHHINSSSVILSREIFFLNKYSLNKHGVKEERENDIEKMTKFKHMICVMNRIRKHSSQQREREIEQTTLTNGTGKISRLNRQHFILFVASKALIPIFNSDSRPI